ncbi:hypothetical protein [Poseidonocella sedimentorum]|uniref:Uncharacterized protein n=1 Tax=Poseidonocella sedimentorum TaxID=871652 RepID=A0A1I6CQF6_9RHOB|nr:hypothetical protein [Poseidonocella sedimentorum]SFQ95426.1 hypothetical protein SAMN04515673_101202 [Poseidonocella sedimentorum]
MDQEDLEHRLIGAEANIKLLAEHLGPKPPKSLWARLLSLESIRNLLYLVGLPVTIVLAYQAFDEEILSAQETRNLAQRDKTIERLDELQAINEEIYRLQTEGNPGSAFAIIEANRGKIARLTDYIHQAWAEQPDMLVRHDLNALAEALMGQNRTAEALEVVRAVKTDGLDPIARIDQKILEARILFAEGPGHDMERAREVLGAGEAMIADIGRAGQQHEMTEKILAVRVMNEFWRGTDCAALVPLAETLREANALSIAASPEGVYADPFQVGTILQGVAFKCG